MLRRLHVVRSGRSSHAACLVLAVALLVAGSVACEPESAPIGPSSNVKFSAVKVINHVLRGNFNGSGPRWEDFSTPAVEDITGDGQPELVFATVDGYVYAVRPTDGHVVWKRDLGHTSIQGSPAIGQIAGSGAADVVVGTMDDRMFVLDGPSGRILRTMGGDRSQFCPGGSNCRPAGFFGTPAIADVDGDFQNDIVASSYDHNVYAWTGTGRQIFRRFIEDTSWSSPVVRDIDGDHKPEVIVGGDIYGGNNRHVPAGGLLWVFTRAGGSWDNYPNYPKSIPGQTVFSTPALADLNGDGAVDIVVGTGNNFATSPESQRVYAFTATSGQSLPGWPVAVNGQVTNGPAVADVDRDGKAEVAFAAEGNRIYVRNRTGTAKWGACTRGGGSCPDSNGSHSAVSMADLDGDGVQEVLATSDHDLVAYDGRSGKVKGRVTFEPGATVGPSGTPTVAVVNHRAYVVFQGISLKVGGPPTAGDTSSVYVFTTGRLPGKMAWPTFKRTSSRSG